MRGLKFTFGICFLFICGDCSDDDNSDMDESSTSSIKEREVALKERKITLEEKKMDSKEKEQENPSNSNSSKSKKQDPLAPGPSIIPKPNSPSAANSNNDPSGGAGANDNQRRNTQLNRATIDYLESIRGTRNTGEVRAKIFSLINQLIADPKQLENIEDNKKILELLIDRLPKKAPKENLNEYIGPIMNFIDALFINSPESLKEPEGYCTNLAKPIKSNDAKGYKLLIDKLEEQDRKPPQLVNLVPQNAQGNDGTNQPHEVNNHLPPLVNVVPVNFSPQNSQGNLGNNKPNERENNPHQLQTDDNEKSLMQKAIDVLSDLGKKNTEKRRSTVKKVVEDLITKHPDQFEPGKYDNRLLLYSIGTPPGGEPEWVINEVLEPVSSIIDMLLQRNPNALKVKENKIKRFLNAGKHKYDDIYWVLKEYTIA